MTFLNQKTNKQKVQTELRANIRQELEGKKSSKTFFKVLERQNLQNQTIFDDNKSKKNSSNPKDICKKYYENLYTKVTTSKTAATEFFNKISNRKKITQ